MKVLVPATIDTAQLTSATIAEPYTGETAWVSAGTYAIGDVRIRTTTHRKYECVQAHTGRAQRPEDDDAYWLDIAPTARWAALDVYTSTQSETTGSAGAATWVLLPGVPINAVALYNCEGGSYTVTVKDGPGGTVVFTETGSLVEDAVGMYEYLFTTNWRYRPKILLTDIEVCENPEITVTVTATASDVAVGKIVVGDYRPLLSDGSHGTLYGAEAIPKDFSFRSIASDGTLTIVRNFSATDLRVRVQLPPDDQESALATVQEVLSIPCAWVGSEDDGYGGLHTFGLGSGSLSHDEGYGMFTIDVTGII